MISITATELPRIMVCMGSRFMSPSVPDTGTDEARLEGNAAHWLAETMFRGGQTIAPGMVAKNGYIVTQEMIEHVGQYVSALDCGEMEVDTSHDGEGWEIRGRADHLVHVTDVSGHSTLTIDDFKYGWRIVEPDRNWTLLSHALGYCLRGGYRPDIIRLRIHQPRPYHRNGPLREWSCTFEQLMGFHIQINERLSNPTDELTTSMEQCAKCHALATCPAARLATMNAIDASESAFDDALPKDVLAHELATLTRAETTIANRRGAVEELMTHRIKMGEVFAGWALEQRQGQRRFKTGLSGRALSLMSGVDLTKDGLVTPAEAERRGLSKAVIAALTERPMLEAKLKPIDADEKARSVFGDVR